jgi:hypothetical protein
VRGRSRLGAVLFLIGTLGACGSLTVTGPPPECEAGRRLALLAQAVPTATFIPCVVADEEQRPAGWSYGALDVERGRARFWLDSDRGGLRAVEVELAESCDTRGATLDRTAGTSGVERYLRVSSVSARMAGTAYDEFDGGCVSYHFDFERTPAANELFQGFQSMVGLFPREQLRDELDDDLGLELDT